MTSPESTTARPRRSYKRSLTLLSGALPVALLASLTTMNHIPFTDISLSVPYAAEGKGPVVNTLSDVDGQPVIEITGAEQDQTEGALSMTTVAVRTNMSLAQVLGRWLFSNDSIVPIETVIPPNQSPEEVQQANEVAFTASESAATVAAMNHLGIDVKIVVAGTIDGSPAVDKLLKNDVILAVDDTPVTRPSEVQQAVRAKSPGDEVTFRILRDGEEKEIPITLAESDAAPGQAVVGVLMVSEPKDDLSVTYNLQDIGGPSAGMMFSLAVIDKLSPGLLNGGKNVAGTGTISEDGSVGAIGGIAHKVEAAHDQGAELFLAPKVNCPETKGRDTGDMVIAAVETIDDAIEAMRNYAEGAEVTTCSN